MVTAYQWPIESPPQPVITAGASPESSGAAFGSLPRRGIIRPFRRDKVNDFATAEGRALISSEVGQILGTRCSSDYSEGELPWRPEFGSLIHLIRHDNNDELTRALAAAYCTDAITLWHPNARVTRVMIEPANKLDELDNMKIRVFWEVKNGSNGTLLGSGSSLVALPNGRG